MPKSVKVGQNFYPPKRKPLSKQIAWAIKRTLPYGTEWTELTNWTEWTEWLKSSKLIQLIELIDTIETIELQFNALNQITSMDSVSWAMHVDQHNRTRSAD